MSSFLTTPSTNPSIAPNLWMIDTGDSLSQLDERSETSSQLDAPLELYFDLDDSMESNTTPTEIKPPEQSVTTPLKGGMLQVAGLRTGRASPTSSIDSWAAASTISLSEDSCFTSLSTNVPLQDLVQYIISHVLTHKRVSIQSVGLAFLASSLHINCSYIRDLSVFDSFVNADDPKLVSRMANILSCLIIAELRASNLNFDACRPLVGVACEQIDSILGNEVATILKAACESLQLCLPLLLASTQPNRGVILLRKVMNLIDVNYWLLKVELLETLAVVDYAQLAVVEPSLLPQILDNVVFPLINDNDHRVRTAVSNNLVHLVKTLDISDHPLPQLATRHVKTSTDHLYVTPTQLSLAGIGRIDSRVIPAKPTSLETVVWHCMMLLGSSEDHLAQRGALEVLCRLSEEYPPPTLPSLWGVNGSQCGLLEMVLQLFRGNDSNNYIVHVYMLKLCIWD